MQPLLALPPGTAGSPWRRAQLDQRGSHLCPYTDGWLCQHSRLFGRQAAATGRGCLAGAVWLRGEVGRAGVSELLATVGRGGPGARCSCSRHGQGDASHGFQILVQILYPLLYADTSIQGLPSPPKSQLYLLRRKSADTGTSFTPYFL